MARLILFGGGDAGGILITSHGIKPVPPFDPRLRQLLRGVNALVHGSAAVSGPAHHELEALTTKLAHVLVAEVQAKVGDLENEGGLVFTAGYDGDGVPGFYCGSTGKPIPFPPPKGGGPHVDPRVADATLNERATIRN